MSTENHRWLQSETLIVVKSVRPTTLHTEKITLSENAAEGICTIYSNILITDYTNEKKGLHILKCVYTHTLKHSCV